MGIFTVSPASVVSSVRGSHNPAKRGGRLSLSLYSTKLVSLRMIRPVSFGKIGIDSFPVGCDENFADLHFYFEAVETFFVGVV